MRFLVKLAAWEGKKNTGVNTSSFHVVPPPLSGFQSCKIAKLVMPVQYSESSLSLLLQEHQYLLGQDGCELQLVSQIRVLR